MSDLASSQRASTSVQQQPSGTSSGSSSSRGSNVVQLKRGLAGMGYAEQEAALAPAREAVQMRAAVQRDETPNRSTPDGGSASSTASYGPTAPTSSGGASTSSASGGGASTTSGAGGGASTSTETHANEGGGGEAGGEEEGQRPNAAGQNTLAVGHHNQISASNANGGTVAFEHEKEFAAPSTTILTPIPGFGFGFGGSLKGTVGGAVSGLSHEHPEVEVGGTLTGEVHADYELGAPGVAYAYLRGQPTIQAAAQIKIDHDGIKEVKADVHVYVMATVGVEVPHVANFSHVLGCMDIGTFTGMKWTRDRGFERGAFNPAEAVARYLAEARGAYDRMLAIERRGEAAVRRAGQVVSRVWNWLLE